MTGAWNNWYHCMTSTYGAWLPGDPRSFRTWMHKEHIPGDYKHPAPRQKFEGRYHNAQRWMKRDPVILSEQMRSIVCLAMGKRLLDLKVQVVELAVTAEHVHLLARFTPLNLGPQNTGIAMPGLLIEKTDLHIQNALHPRIGMTQANSLQDGRDPVPRHVMGLVKKHTSHIARDYGIVGGLWAVRYKVVPVRNRSHQIAVVNYIREHRNEGGVIWSDIQRGIDNSNG